MYTRDVTIVDGGQPTTILAPPDTPHTHLAPAWAAASHDEKYCRARQPTTTVRVRDIATGAEFEIPPALIDDMPPADADIVYRIRMSETNQLVGRLMPVRTLDTAETADPAAFGTRRDAATLFLGRYMPYSRAALISMRDEALPSIVLQILTLVPGMLFIFGYIDAQGAQQAFADFFPTTPYSQAPAAWWRHLLVSSRAMQQACAITNTHRVQANATIDTLMATLVEKSFALAHRDATSATLWLSDTADLRNSIYEYYATYGRVGGACRTFSDALHSYDMMFWRSSAAVLQMRDQMAGWLEPPANLHALGPEVHVAAGRLASALPVVVFADVERWRPYDLSYALATLLLAAPHTRDAAGMYAVTGSAVPVKVVFLFHASKFTDTYAPLTPQAKS